MTFQPPLNQVMLGNTWRKYDVPKFVSSLLYDLSKLLYEKNPENQVHGCLGGDYGYGQEFKNEVFEMFPYYWGDCNCGYEEKEEEWFKFSKKLNETERESNWQQFQQENAHSLQCGIVRPNFHHFASDTEISWYKYIYRGMSCNQKWGHDKWMEIFQECINSLN